MIGIIISFLIAALVIYALYNALGYYDETKRAGALKDIENILMKKVQALQEDKNLKEFIVENNKIETEIIRNLDTTSQENLSKINLENQSLSLIKFKNFCDENYSFLLKSIHDQKLNELQDFLNEQSFEKIKKISAEDAKKLNLIKINQILIKEIKIENDHVIITVNFESEEMFNDTKDHFANIKKSRVIHYGCQLGQIKENKWIILEIQDNDFFQ